MALMIRSAAVSAVVKDNFSWRLTTDDLSCIRSLLDLKRLFLAMLVRMPPGKTTDAETPVPLSSWFKDSVKPRMANLLELYAAWVGMAHNPNTLETFTIWAARLDFRFGKKARDQKIFMRFLALS